MPDQGDMIAVWEEKTPFRDPKTDIVSIAKKIKVHLQITELTSGLTAIEKVNSGDISLIEQGDIVTLLY